MTNKRDGLWYASVVEDLQGGGWSGGRAAGACDRWGADGGRCRCATPWRNRTRIRSAASSRCPAVPPRSARPRWSGCRWRSTASTRPAASTGREVELIVADDESKPDVGRRKAEKLLVEDKVDAHVGGVLSNICLACMPVCEGHKIVNMIGVCLDTTITTSKCSRYTFRPFDYAPAQAVAFAPYLVNKLGKKWHIAYADYAWGQSTRDAYADEIKKAGGEVVGATGIPLGTADMTPFLSKISGDFDGLFIIFFGKDAINDRQPGLRSRSHQEIQIAGDGAVAESTSNLPALGNKIDGFIGINRYIPVLEGPLDTPYNKKFFDEAAGAAEGGRPDQPVARPLRAIELRGDERLKLGIEKSGFQGRKDTLKLIKALEGLEMKEGDDFPQGDKTCARRTTRPSSASSSSRSRTASTRSWTSIPKEKTIVPPACKFAWPK